MCVCASVCLCGGAVYGSCGNGEREKEKEPRCAPTRNILLVGDQRVDGGDVTFHDTCNTNKTDTLDEEEYEVLVYQTPEISRGG